MLCQPRFIGFLLPLSLCVSLATGSRARADVFVLTSGGRIQGEWLNREPAAANYEVRTDLGKVSLEKAQVKEVIRHRPGQVEYEQIAPTFRDTIEDHWKLQEWCRQRSLTAQREQHLRRIIELDETVHQAWRALGYSQVSGRWVAKGDVSRENGMEFHKGRWRLKQEIQVLEEQASAKQAERDWQTKIKKLRTVVMEGFQPQAARAEILAIRSPHAVRPLAQFLEAETNRSLSLLYVEALEKMNSPSAQMVLFGASLGHRDVEVFHACVNVLVRTKTPALIEQYTKVLRDENNERVNRAAYVLGRFGESSAIGPLIDALVTSHTIVSPARGNPQATSASFGSVTDASGKTLASGPSFSRGQGPTVQVVKIPNQEALNALGKLAGDATFGFDQVAWKNWYGVWRQGTTSVEARRDSN